MSGRIAYYGNIIRDGLVLHLDAGKVDSYPRTGTLWRDLSGNNNNGTLTNFSSPSPQTIWNGDNGGSIIFDGTNDYVTSNTIIQNNSNFSISFWINYKDTLVSSRGLITTWDTSWNGVAIASSPTGNIRSWANNGAAGGMNWVATSTIQNQWVNLVLTYDYSTKTQSGYVNGVFKISETLGTTLTHSPLQIGRGGQTSSTQLSNYPNTNCLISNVLIYNKVLTQSEITQNYNALKGRYNL